MLTLDTQAWVYAHMQLTPEEAAEYKNVPVVYNGDVGFFFEPNESVSAW
jgi:sarcosine oxidase/L-pipecolate oxidase